MPVSNVKKLPHGVLAILHSQWDEQMDNPT